MLLVPRHQFFRVLRFEEYSPNPRDSSGSDEALIGTAAQPESSLYQDLARIKALPLSMKQRHRLQRSRVEPINIVSATRIS